MKLIDGVPNWSERGADTWSPFSSFETIYSAGDSTKISSGAGTILITKDGMNIVATANFQNKGAQGLYFISGEGQGIYMNAYNYFKAIRVTISLSSPYGNAGVQYGRAKSTGILPSIVSNGSNRGSYYNEIIPTKDTNVNDVLYAPLLDNSYPVLFFGINKNTTNFYITKIEGIR